MLASSSYKLEGLCMVMAAKEWKTLCSGWSKKVKLGLMFVERETSATLRNNFARSKASSHPPKLLSALIFGTTCDSSQAHTLPKGG